ncbi:PREDICTED: uncharacterized protein LOC109590936 [Amphimedon queenslandica]|uniref:DOMON domain-containing protein n=1 Tax=Amphimedon queenslandica TaxID=400682 RepID=A0AAN0JZI2_AMPQE|nr:PREDICTED: uncharacterized protein LOC109590936 [Amphimedon queenslandica]|eukprot:XP_019862333.1 PREDICTED: uncharacterized protein LOC109590936 [Amphimedon queenslandica]
MNDRQPNYLISTYAASPMINVCVLGDLGQPVVSFLYKHSSTPTPSSVQYNPMRDSTTPAPPTDACPQAPSSDATYPFRVGSPGDDYYFAARFNSDNSSFIDMQLEGSADGWIAVGFTGTRDMVQQSV